MHRRALLTRVIVLAIAAALFAFTLSPALAQGRGQPANAAPAGPWMNKSLPPDERADLLIQQMTIDDKIQLLHGLGGGGFGSGRGAPAGAATPPTIEQLTQQLTATRSNGGAGFIPGIPRLGIPDLQMADAAVGVTRGSMRSRYSTPLPSTTSAASSWDPKLAYEYGALIGRELRDQGYNMSLGGGANITREPRNGRNFEYLGEDPILAGRLDGQMMKGLQAQGVLGDVKHYAFNDQETGRNIGNVLIPDKRVMRETDLLAYEIAVKDADVSAVMCAYNKINGDYACENSYTLNDVLKKAFGFKGFVLSDWGGTHSTVKAALAGLDIEMPGNTYFADALKKAVESGEVPVARLNDMVHRVLRSEFAVGLFDNRPATQVVDVFGGLEVAQRVAEAGTVVLKNANGQLPLSAPAIRSIAIIGSHADAGVLSGGGSAQVNPPGGNAVPPPPAGAVPGPAGGFGGGRGATWYPSSPLKAIRAKTPKAKVEYNDGTDPVSAAALAKASDVAIVFCNQPTSEGRDVPSLSLPDNQDALVAAVAAANPHTIVVLETGGPVSMPWIDKTNAVLEAWYPGIRGAEAIANILFGDVNPSAKTVITFAKSDADLPHPEIPGIKLVPQPSAGGGRGAGAPGVGGGRGAMPPFDIPYTEGLLVGYKWYDAGDKAPLFPFGHGLSYTTFAYSGLKTTVSGKEIKVSFSVKNTGKRPGTEIAQVYVSLPAGASEPPKRLVAWDKIHLAAGEAKTVSLAIDPFHLSVFNVAKDAWEVLSGEYKVMVGGSSRETPLTAAVNVAAGTP
ncbi:MAG: glycoside hydrolase family 3 C-terminal domain-containing protein [Bryobacteraceae bacterium]|jgi:beta-glucosidase